MTGANPHCRSPVERSRSARAALLVPALLVELVGMILIAAALKSSGPFEAVALAFGVVAAFAASFAFHVAATSKGMDAQNRPLSDQRAPRK